MKEKPKQNKKEVLKIKLDSLEEVAEFLEEMELGSLDEKREVQNHVDIREKYSARNLGT